MYTAEVGGVMSQHLFEECVGTGQSQNIRRAPDSWTRDGTEEEERPQQTLNSNWSQFLVLLGCSFLSAFPRTF